MGDVLIKENGTWSRAEMKIGDGTSTGGNIIPIWDNPDGVEIRIPQHQNMLLNLCKYTFMLNDKKTCSLHIDGSDLPIGPCSYSNGTRTINTSTFGDLLSQHEDNFTGASNHANALNVSKGVYYIKTGVSPNVGFLLPKNGEVLTNEGDSFTLSISFAFNNASREWVNMFGFIANNSGISTDGILRVEKYTGNALSIYWNPTASGSANGIEILNGNGHDHIHNLIIRGTRQDATQGGNLILDAWMNGVRKATNHNIGVYRGSPKNLIYWNCGRDDTTTSFYGYYFACRVWNSRLTDDEISMLQKIEARNLGFESYFAADGSPTMAGGVPLWDYLN